MGLSAIDAHPPLPGEPIVVDFENGQARGGSGCHTDSGAYAMRGETLAIGKFMATACACAQPARKEQELACLSRLAAAEAYSRSPGRLALRTAEGAMWTFALLR